MKTTPHDSGSSFGHAFVRIVLLTLLSAFWQAGLAAPVTSKQAAAVVTGWLSKDPAPLGETLGQSVQHVDTFDDQAGNPVYYVVYLDLSGFVIVAADDLVEPIVGFARAGQFDPSNANPLGALVSNDLSARVAYAKQATSTSTDTNALRAQAKWQRFSPADGGPVITPMGIATVSDVRIAPLTQTTWSQETAADAGSAACYNYYTPPYLNGTTANYPAGCVATAMSQLMRYYQFPSTGIGSAPFTITNGSTPLTYYTRGGDGSGGPYIWGNMPLVPPDVPDTVQCQAIGALLADAGATVSMQYSSAGSSSRLLDAKTALCNTFHYPNAIKGWKNNGDIGAGLVGMINPNLDARYPVLLGIEGSGVGHAVVADGYGYSASTLYHHLNLGWSGQSSAWYSLPLIDTAHYTFSSISGCVYNAYTNGSGEIISGRVLDQIGRPVVNASVTATRTGGGNYSTTTDAQGIYALARIPSASSYSITITKANYTSANTNLSTGTSSDMASTSGNKWGNDLTLSMLTSAVDQLVWGAVAPIQALNTPFGVTIMAQNVTNGPATDFTGPVGLSAYASGLVSGGTIIRNLSPSSGISSTAGRTQGYAFTPSTNILVTHVRAYTGDSVSIWTDSGTPLASQAISANGSWVEAALTTPVNLSAGTTYRVTARYDANIVGWYSTTWPTTFTNGSIGQNFYGAFGDTFPLQVEGTREGPLVDLRYQVVFSNAISVSPTSSSAFAGGVWNGTITVSQAATNVVLKADDSAGHVAFSTPFNLITPILLLSPQRPAAGPFTCAVSSALGQHLEILASTNLSSWATIATLTNSTGTTNFTDSAAGLGKRFYRAHQLQ